MRTLRLFAITAALVLCLSACAYAGSNASQNTESEHNGQGYAFFGPGALTGDGYTTGMAHIGGGGEILVYKGVGVGAEVGYFTPWRDFRNGIGIVSVDGSYHFNRTRKLSPFVTAGYSWGIRNGHVDLFNFGGGIHYWFHDRVGLRLEFRDHLYKDSDHFLSGRIGLSFR